MLNSGFVQLPRSLFHDPIWQSLSAEYRNIFMTIIMNCAWKEEHFNDFGVLTIVQPGQFLTTERALIELCFPPTKDSKNLSKYKSMIHRSLEKFEKLKFSNHKTNHKKTIITILREDILSCFEPRKEPIANQERTKSEPQMNKSNNSISKESYPLTPNGGSEVVPFIHEILVGIKTEMISEHQKKILSKDFTHDQIAAALEYASTIEIKDSLFGIVRWHCNSEEKPTPRKNKEEIFEINKKFAYEISECQSDVARYERNYKYCEIIIFGNCSTKTFSYADEKPEIFSKNLSDALKAYRLIKNDSMAYTGG